MNPLKARKLSHLRAQTSILRSSGVLAVQENAKVLEKSERWVVNGRQEQKILKTRNEVVDLRS